MRRPDSLWILSDIWAHQRLRLRGALLLAGGTLLGDQFMKLAGRFDLNASRRTPRLGAVMRRVDPR